MKTVKLVLYAAFAVVLATTLAAAAAPTFKAALAGTQEVPAVTTTAEGEAAFELGEYGKELTFVLTVKDIENVTAAHIHAGKTGENGGVVVGLFAGPKKDGKFSGVLAKGAITDKDLVGALAGKTIDDLVKLIKDGGAYVNVHTEKNKPGEIRGQLK
jgi:hypothetical protein